MDAPKKAEDGKKIKEQESKVSKNEESFFIKLMNWWNNPENSFFVSLIILGLVIVGSWIWFGFFKGLIQYLPSWAHLIVLFVSTYVVFSSFSKVVKDSEKKKRKLIKWLPILLVFIFYFLPSLDLAKVDPNGKTLEWINIKNGTTYHRPVYEIHEDSMGKYFFDPRTGDTCRRATDYWKQVQKRNKPISKSVYITTYDTLVDKVYTVKDLNKDGYIRTHVYGYDINDLDNPEIIVINLKGKDDRSVIIARVKKTKKIYASYRNPIARYKYTDKICQDVDGSVVIDIIGDSKARILLLNQKRVKQSLAQK
jgi:hypothetical protein